MTPEAPERSRVLTDGPVRPEGAFVLYWMTASRRTTDNFALDRARQWERELGVPVLVLEALRVDYDHASARLHRFVLDGMRDNAAALSHANIAYYPYVEPRKGAGRGLLAALATRAAVVVTDDHPGFFLPRMLRRAKDIVQGRFEAVDSVGLLPLAFAERDYLRAVDFRRHLQRTVLEGLPTQPKMRLVRSTLRPACVPPEVEERFARARPAALDGGSKRLATLPIVQTVPPVGGLAGGPSAARARLRTFMDERLAHYGARGDALAPMTSGLSPYLHFGHLSAQRIVRAVFRAEGWTEDRLGTRAAGQKEGFWGMSAPAEAFLDELLVWRELCQTTAVRRERYDRYESLPDWALQTLDAHRGDPRPSIYSLEELESPATHDPLWNAAQRQLARTGQMHGYLRMLWGKKILEWSESPEQALRAMLVLNDRYALDGRDPNSVGGIFWCLGRYDRPFGPERAIFGKIRYMSSDGARRKFDLDGYLETYGPTD